MDGFKKSTGLCDGTYELREKTSQISRILFNLFRETSSNQTIHLTSALARPIVHPRSLDKIARWSKSKSPEFFVINILFVLILISGDVLIFQLCIYKTLLPAVMDPTKASGVLCFNGPLPPTISHQRLAQESGPRESRSQASRSVQEALDRSQKSSLPRDGRGPSLSICSSFFPSLV